MPQYKITKKATEDLSEIWKYTFKTWSENQADLYYESLIQSFNTIVNQPSIGKKYQTITNQLLGLNVNKHIVFYRVVNDNDVEIIRILHERMDLKNRINE